MGHSQNKGPRIRFVVVKPKVVGFKGLCEAKPTMGLISGEAYGQGALLFIKPPSFFSPHLVSFGKKCKNTGGSFQKIEMLAHSKQTMGEH